MIDSNSLLIIDDDRQLCELLTEFFTGSGWTVATAHDALRGVELALSGEHDAAVVDVMLPPFDGFEVVRRVRARSRLPVVMLTARGESVDRIVGLELGADDYLPKPFNPRELAARLHAVLRRTRGQEPPATPGERIVVGDVELEPAARVAWRAGQHLELTGTEFAVLELLLRSAGRVVSREEIGRRVLGRRVESYDRSIDMHISNIRRKLGPPRRT